MESTAARDFLAVKAWFDDDAAEPDLIGDFQKGFRNLDLRRETKRATSVYNGIFNLLVIGGARDWMTGNVPQYGDLDDITSFRKAWGKAHDAGAAIDSIPNRTLLTTETNRHVISDRLPNQFLPELSATSGEAMVRDMLASHFISSEAFSILLREPEHIPPRLTPVPNTSIRLGLR